MNDNEIISEIEHKYPTWHYLHKMKHVTEIIRREERQNMIKMIDDRINKSWDEECRLDKTESDCLMCCRRMELEELKSQLQSQDIKPITTKVEVGEYKSSAVGTKPDSPDAQTSKDEVRQVQDNGVSAVMPSGLQTLSDKRYTYDGERDDGTPKLHRIIAGENADDDLFFVKDVKEAIKKLKDKLYNINPCYCEDMPENGDLGITKVCDNCFAHSLIDKIFGKRLVEE